MSTREMSVAGSFYPAHPDEITAMIHRFNALLDDHPEVSARLERLSGRAFIVPHAGWIYSGFTANVAFRILARYNPKTVVVIGPSHRVGFEGVSIADMERYQTPLGTIEIDAHLTKTLSKRFSLPTLPQAHREHSTEVQAPFIRYYLPETQIVELVYSYTDPSRIAPILSACLEEEDTALIISTDLSHFYPQEQANRIDALCLEAMERVDTVRLHEGCEACGIIGIEAMLKVAKAKGMESVILDYRTSADASGDTSRVVGYGSVLFQTAEKN
jgi:MEMO1 family protein